MNFRHILRLAAAGHVRPDPDFCKLGRIRDMTIVGITTSHGHLPIYIAVSNLTEMLCNIPQ